MSIKVHLFKVNKTESSAPFETVLEMIGGNDALHARIRTVNKVELRIEAIQRHEHFWLLDFVQIKMDHGPCRASRDSGVTGFDFNAEEGFGEETGALYHPNSGYILIQYNH